jgi:class 3 adenylate cyclase
MTNVETALARYVFLDIVSFTQNRSVEAQSDLVAAINSMVRSSLTELNIPKENTILLPTGDGMCIVLLDIKQYDIHLQLAVKILAEVSEHNDHTEDKMRKFAVRIGVNQNEDNIVEDINGNRNIAGSGINMAQRVMSLADGGQVLVGQAVHDTLSARETYMGLFQQHWGRDKHGIHFPVFHYIPPNYPHLNVEIPTIFRTHKHEPKLTQYSAYFIAHSLKNKEFIVTNSDASHALVTLLHFKAIDSVKNSGLTEFEEPDFDAYKEGLVPIEEQFSFYKSIDFNVLWQFHLFVRGASLESYSKCFVQGQHQTLWGLISEYGAEKLQHEWPEIWHEFELDAKPLP